MNYVAFAMYKHKLRNMNYEEARDFCFQVAFHQSERLMFSLMQAIKMTKPELILWYREIVKSII